MDKKIQTKLSVLITGLALLLALVACGSENANGGQVDQASTQEMTTGVGTLILKVNPEIEIDYDETGKVTNIRANNAEAEEIIADYSDYIGKDSNVVLKELIGRIGEAGYFVEETEGDNKKIVIELEAGSEFPNDNFIEQMAKNAQEAVEEYKYDSQVSYDDNTLISLEEAQKIAFEHAEVDGSKVNFDDVDLDADDGEPHYELEFIVDGEEYEYDVHALTGEILKSKREYSDDSEHRQEMKEKLNNGDYISFDQAKKIAFEDAGVLDADIRLYYKDFDWEDDLNAPVYKLMFMSGNDEFEYEINAVNSEIVEVDHDVKEGNSSPKETTLKEAEISQDGAVNIALKHAGVKSSEVTFDDIELDRGFKRSKWEIEFYHKGWEYDYEVDANTGEIIEFDSEFDD